MIHVTAETSFEVEVTLTGTFLPGCPEQGPTYACGGQPAELDSMEDIEVTGLFGIRRKGSVIDAHPKWERVDLLAGVSSVSPEAVLKILANICDFVGHDAEEQLLANLPEDDRE